MAISSRSILTRFTEELSKGVLIETACYDLIKQYLILILRDPPFNVDKEESHLLWAADEPHKILECEVDSAGIVHKLYGVGQLRVLRGTGLLINLN